MWRLKACDRGVDCLQRTLPTFLANFIEFVPQGSNMAWQLLDLYSSLGVHIAVATKLAEMQVVWQNGKLNVSETFQGTEGLIEQLTTLLLGAYHFHKCTDSRWVSLGASCSSLMAALCLGLDMHVHVCLADPPKGCTTYYLRGYKQLNESARTYASIAALGSSVADRAL